MIDGLSLRFLPQLASGKQRGKYRALDRVIPATEGVIVSQREGLEEQESRKRERGRVNPSTLIAGLFFDSHNRHVVLFYFACNVSRNCPALRQRYILVIAAPTAAATGMLAALCASFISLPSLNLSFIQVFSRFLTSVRILRLSVLRR